MGSHLSGEFFKSSQEITGKLLDVLRQNYFIEANMKGSDDASIAGLRVNKSGRQNSRADTGKGSSNAVSDQLFFALLDDMRNRLADLEENMARLHEKLSQKYEGNVVSGMAETYLSEGELEGLKTDEDKLRALADKFLDENGNIKEEYKNTDEEKYIRDWHEAKKLKPIVAKYDGRDTLEPHEKQEILDVAKSASLTESKSMIMLSQNQELQTIVDQKVENSAADLNSTQSTNQVTFGS